MSVGPAYLRTIARAGLAAAVLLGCTLAEAARFGEPGGPVPANLDAVFGTLRQDRHDLELLISFGTSKGGSAGHLALAVRGTGDDDTVYSANFYADRLPERAQGFYTAELMIAVPKKEYLYGTRSSLGETASFGLDYGEVYKRSVIGVRVAGVPQAETEALVSFFARLNDDYRRRAPRTEYHGGEITYDYMNLNCAKTIGAAFRHGAGYTGLEVRDPLPLASLFRAVAAVSANIPMDMALKLLEQWHARGYSMDMVLYKKWPFSSWIDPHDDPPMAFGALPDRFPSVLSLDYRADEGRYEDEDNLYAMYLLHNLGHVALRIDPATNELLVERSARTMPFDEAARLARANAADDSKSLLRRLPVRARGAAGFGADVDHPYDFTGERR